MTKFVIIAVISAILLYYLSKYDLKNYSDILPYRHRSYGDKTKPTIVIIPGLDGATSFFNDIVPELTPNYHVLVYNIPLYNRSAIDPTYYTFNYLSDQLKVLLDDLNITTVSIVGESFGGIIAQHFAISHENYLNKLILLSSLAKTELPADIQWKLDYILPIIEKIGSYFPSIAQFLFAQIHVYDVFEESESNYLKKLFIKEAAFAHFFSVIARIRIASKLDIISQVRKIKTKTLIIYGLQDHFTKIDSIRLHTYIQTSQLSGLPGGHLCHLTSPKKFSELVNTFISTELIYEKIGLGNIYDD